ncbi:MAG: hypothetical protein AAF225_10150 [Pseudomonadota bacterium]
MCEPATLLALSGGVSAIGSGVSTYSKVAAGRAQASINRYNARVQEVQAQDARYRGSVEETQQRLAGAAQLSRAKVVMAANGVDISSGSPLSVLEGQAMLNEIDAQIIRTNAEREEQFYQRRGVDFQNQGRIADRGATFAAIGGGFDVISTGFEAASQYRNGA